MAEGEVSLPRRGAGGEGFEVALGLLEGTKKLANIFKPFKNTCVTLASLANKNKEVIPQPTFW